MRVFTKKTDKEKVEVMLAFINKEEVLFKLRTSPHIWRKAYNPLWVWTTIDYSKRVDVDIKDEDIRT